MKKTKRLHKQLTLSRETVRDLMTANLRRAVGGKVVTSDGDGGENHNSCNTACNQFSCSIC